MAELANKARRIFINSTTKDSGDTNSRFTQRFSPALTGCQSISLVNASIPYLVYPFSGIFSTLAINDGTGSGYESFTIPSQTYDDGSDFIAVMNDVFTTAGADLEFSFDANTNKLTLTNSTGSGGVDIVASAGALKLGFSASQTGSLVSSITAANMPRFDATQVIYVVLENIGQSGGDSQFPTNRIISQINVNTTFGGIIQQQTDVEERALPTPLQIPELQIRLLDENFQELDLDENANVCMEFYVKHINGNFESSL